MNRKFRFSMFYLMNRLLWRLLWDLFGLLNMRSNSLLDTGIFSELLYWLFFQSRLWFMCLLFIFLFRCLFLLFWLLWDFCFLLILFFYVVFMTNISTSIGMVDSSFFCLVAWKMLGRLWMFLMRFRMFFMISLFELLLNRLK